MATMSYIPVYPVDPYMQGIHYKVNLTRFPLFRFMIAPTALLFFHTQNTFSNRILDYFKIILRFFPVTGSENQIFTSNIWFILQFHFRSPEPKPKIILQSVLTNDFCPCNLIS
jgi:hypothetical protein